MLRADQLVEERPVHPQRLAERLGIGGRGGVPPAAQAALPLGDRRLEPGRHLREDVGGLADRGTRVVDELVLDPVPLRPQVRRVRDQARVPALAPGERRPRLTGPQLSIRSRRSRSRRSGRNTRDGRDTRQRRNVRSGRRRVPALGAIRLISQGYRNRRDRRRGGPWGAEHVWLRHRGIRDAASIRTRKVRWLVLGLVALLVLRRAVRGRGGRLRVGRGSARAGHRVLGGAGRRGIGGAGRRGIGGAGRAVLGGPVVHPVLVVIPVIAPVVGTADRPHLFRAGLVLFRARLVLRVGGSL